MGCERITYQDFSFLGVIHRKNATAFKKNRSNGDHLGNIRLSYSDANNNGSIEVTSDPLTTEIVEENNYYPFGLKHKGYNGNQGAFRNHKYGFGGKEEQDELGLGWIDITARNYDPALGRWMNLDLLANEYSTNSPYNYAINNPIYFIDPDGMKIINGDAVEKKEKEEELKKKQEYFKAQLKSIGLEGMSKREIRKKLGRKSSTYKGFKAIRSQISNLESEVKNLDTQTKKSDAKINELKNDAPLLFEKLDAMSTDIYFRSTNHLPGLDGGNEIRFNNDNENQVFLISSFGDNTIVVKTVNSPSGDRTTLEVSQHELGHSDYIITNKQKYYEWLKSKKLLNSKHDGHKKGDPSGKMADEYGKKNFKKEKNGQ